MVALWILTFVNQGDITYKNTGEIAETALNSVNEYVNSIGT